MPVHEASMGSLWRKGVTMEAGWEFSWKQPL